MIKHCAVMALCAPFFSGCAPQETAEVEQLQQKIFPWNTANSAQAFGGEIASTAIRGIFYSTTPPRGTTPSPTNYWLRSQTTDYFAPITSITYDSQLVSTLTAAQGFLQVTTADGTLPVQGTALNLDLQIGAPVNATLRVLSAQPSSRYGQYTAVWRAHDNDPWSAFCPHPYTNSDNQITNLVEYMIPVDGARWLVDGRRIDDSSAIQLSCTHDSIGGCIAWGYAPWEKVSGASMKDVHQACTRMKRADFCGTGDPVTTLNQSAYLHTSIQVWDALGIHTAEPQTAATMEAAWNTEGAICVNSNEYRSDLPNYVAHKNALLASCPKPACTSTSSGLTASARPCLGIDADEACIQN